MLSSKKATTIVEAMIVMVIIVIGVVGMYTIFNNSQKISDSASYRLTAISIAREGIEAMSNIRDTNWLLFGANTENCWFTNNYNSNCIVADGVTNPYTHFASGSYILKTDEHKRWFLENKPTGSYSGSTYRNDFAVNKDTNGFYTQSGGTAFFPPFTREIQISYPGDAYPLGVGTAPQKVDIKSIVRWKDSSKASGNFEIILQSSLTNWKKD